MVPIAIQQLFISGMALLDNMFVGQIDETAVTAVSLAYQVYFILSILYFGINSGSAIFTAQFWGKNDIESIRKVVGLNLIVNISLGIVVTILAELFPEFILGLYTKDPAVIAAGTPYIRTYAVGYIFTGVTMGLYGLLRSTQNVKVPMVVNSLALMISTGLGYILIFGKLGFAPLGIQGAAIANVTAKVLEFVALVMILVVSKSFLLLKLNNLFPIRRDFIWRFITMSAPVVVNELFWSVGVSMYNSIYAHISTDSAAAMNIASTLESMAFVPFIGLGNACAILIGNQIGADQQSDAIHSARKTLMITVGSGIVMGVIIYLIRGSILQVYHISAETRQAASTIISWLSLAMVFKTCNIVLIIGVLRAGGDTRFTLGIELLTIWGFGVPAAWIGANVFHLPVYWIVPIVLCEEVIKTIIVFTRYRSQKWIHHLAHSAV